MSFRMIQDVLRTRDIQSHCPLCGREAAKAPHTEEHIFPLWLQHRHGLLNSRLTIPNLLDKTYKSVKTGICARCNNETFGRLETRVSSAFMSSNPWTEVAAIGDNEIAAWVGKILWLLARKTNSFHDHRTRTKAKPDRIIPSDLLAGLRYVAMFLRCYARSKAMYAAQLVAPPLLVAAMVPPYSLYMHEIDLRDEGAEAFDFMDSPLFLGTAIRSGGIGIICFFDGGFHRRFHGERYSFLNGNKLHPVQFRELFVRILCDQITLDPRTRFVKYYWEKSLDAVVTETPVDIEYPPYRRELYDPALQARMMGLYTSQEPDDLLFNDGSTLTTLKCQDGSFLHYPVTSEEIEAARRLPGWRRSEANESVRARLIGEAWALQQTDDKPIWDPATYSSAGAPIRTRGSRRKSTSA